MQLKEVEKPTPKDDEVLIKIHAASVNAYDWHLLTADIFLIRLMGGGLLRPKNTFLALTLPGRVEAVGTNVKQFQPGGCGVWRYFRERQWQFCRVCLRVPKKHWR